MDKHSEGGGKGGDREAGSRPSGATPQSQPEPAHQRPTSFPWPPVLLVGAVLAALGLQRLFPIPWPGMDDLPAQLIGYGFGLTGLILIAWSAVTLRRHRTTILPHAGADALVTDGPFAWRRNPIYLGDVFIMFGLAELTDNIWFVAVALMFALAVTYLAILPEERHLEAKFGDAYRAYKERTRRWL